MPKFRHEKWAVSGRSISHTKAFHFQGIKSLKTHHLSAKGVTRKEMSFQGLKKQKTA